MKVNYNRYFKYYIMEKTVVGEIRNKEKTKQKLIDAVGTILAEEGYSKLGINNIARKALVDKKLIYRYFGGIDELISSYFRQKDFWKTRIDKIYDDMDLQQGDYGKEMSAHLLVSLFDHLQQFEETRKMLLWEITESNRHIKKLSYEREMFGKDFFLKTDPVFEGSDIDLRACSSLLLAGIYYLSLHSKACGGTFCEIDIKKEEDSNRIKKSISDILELIYSTTKCDHN